MNQVVIKLLLKINKKLNELGTTGSKILSLDRYFLLDTQDERVLLHLSEGVLSEAELNSHEPDITVTTTVDELEGLLEKRIKPLESYSKGRIKIKSSFMDKLLFSELLS